MKLFVFLIFVNIFLVGCNSTSTNKFNENLAKVFEMHKSAGMYSHLSEDELALMIKAHDCESTLKVLRKYDYEILSVTKNTIVYLQPDKSKMTRVFEDDICAESSRI